MNDQDRFEYEYRRFMEDPAVQMELALRDLDVAVANLRSVLTKHFGPESSLPDPNIVKTWDNLPF